MILARAGLLFVFCVQRALGCGFRAAGPGVGESNTYPWGSVIVISDRGP